MFIVNAPDGSLHVADFYEHYIAHGQHYQSQIDPTTGRRVDLESFGPTNAGVFAQMLAAAESPR